MLPTSPSSVTTDATVSLPRGVRYGYTAYGDPGGVPVLFMHGTPGSRRTPGWLLRGRDLQGLRILAVERPGWGLSTPQPRARVSTVVADIDGICEALGLDRVVVLGMSGGGPYAYAAAAALPHRVCGAVVVSGAVPTGRADHCDCEPDVRAMSLLGRWAPATLLQLLAAQMRRSAGDLDDPAAWERSVARLPEPDRSVMSALIEDPEFRTGYRDDITEAYRTTAGFVRDCRDLARLPQASPCQVPVQVLHGSADRNVPLSAVRRYYAAHPQAKVTVLDAGHLLLLSDWPQVRDAILQMAARP